MDEPAGLTIAELSSLSGEPLDEVRDWAELGLLPGEDGTLPRSYLHRTRLIRFVADRGIAPKELAEITAEQDLLAWFERDLPEIPEGTTYAFDDLADLIAQPSESFTCTCTRCSGAGVFMVRHWPRPPAG